MTSQGVLRTCREMGKNLLMFDLALVIRALAQCLPKGLHAALLDFSRQASKSRDDPTFRRQMSQILVVGGLLGVLFGLMQGNTGNALFGVVLTLVGFITTAYVYLLSELIPPKRPVIALQFFVRDLPDLTVPLGIASSVFKPPIQ